jgi:hypothetical protein
LNLCLPSFHFNQVGRLPGSLTSAGDKHVEIHPPPQRI